MLNFLVHQYFVSTFGRWLYFESANKFDGSFALRCVARSTVMEIQKHETNVTLGNSLHKATTATRCIGEY